MPDDTKKSNSLGADAPLQTPPAPSAAVDSEPASAKETAAPKPLNDAAAALVDNGLDVAVANSMVGPGSNI
jgi:hypothetical protein